MSVYEKQKKDRNKIKVLREFLHGFKFSFRMDGVKVSIFKNAVIKKAHQPIPAIEF